MLKVRSIYIFNKIREKNTFIIGKILYDSIDKEKYKDERCFSW